MTGKELRVQIAEQISKRLLKPSNLKGNTGRASPIRLPWKADAELTRYLKSSAHTFKSLDGKAFVKARQFYRTPSPNRQSERRKSSFRNLKLPAESKIATPEILTERKPPRSKTPWLTETASKYSETMRQSPDQTQRSNSPINRLKNLDNLISDITNHSVKEKRFFNLSVRQGKQRYSKLKELVEMTRDEDMNQFRE
mmetsp:Transcript_20269/g.37861  ORF Transcript_20269/g.37861 Transcript_20269/m.37861 type:complete len:197 (+) Transcript_20269:5614-6204(+)